MKHPFYRCAAAAFVATALFAGPAAAEEDHIAPIKELAATKVAVWTASPILVDAVNAQNAANAAITQGDIDKMDKTWRAEIKSGGGPMSQKILANALSAYLKKVKSESAGLYSEIFVMDNKGLARATRRRIFGRVTKRNGKKRTVPGRKPFISARSKPTNRLRRFNLSSACRLWTRPTARLSARSPLG